MISLACVFLSHELAVASTLPKNSLVYLVIQAVQQGHLPGMTFSPVEAGLTSSLVCAGPAGILVGRGYLGYSVTTFSALADSCFVLTRPRS